MLLEKGSRKQRHVLIADGVTEIGAAAVHAFAERGATSAFLCGDQFKEALALSRETGALNIKCNVFNRESMESAMEVADAFFEHRLDTVVCNMGLDLPENLKIQEFDQFTEILHCNVDSVRAFLNRSLSMMEEGGNAVILLPEKGSADEAEDVIRRMVRGTVGSMIQAAAPVLTKRGIRMNGIAVAEGKSSPVSVAKVIRFLSSSDSGEMTGKILQL